MQLDELSLSVAVFNAGMVVSGVQVYRKPNTGEEKTYEIYGNNIQFVNEV